MDGWRGVAGAVVLVVAAGCGGQMGVESIDPQAAGSTGCSGGGSNAGSLGEGATCTAATGGGTMGGMAGAATGSTSSVETGGGAGTEPAVCIGMPHEGPPDFEPCVGLALEKESVLVHLLLVVDRSAPMGTAIDSAGTTRLEAIAGAVREFGASSPENLGVVLVGAVEGDRCDPANYESPSVPICAPPGAGVEIASAIASIGADGPAPLVPGLQGAVSYAKEWALANPYDRTRVALVGAGIPTDCGDDPKELVAVARTAFEEEPSIVVGVIGVGSPADTAADIIDPIASAGGTGRAVRAADETLQEDIHDALLDVSSVPVYLACSFTIPQPPPGEQLDPTQALFLVRAHDGTTTELPRVDGVGDCPASPWGGWYFDDPAAPQEITVCPCTCESLDVEGLEIRIGCTE